MACTLISSEVGSISPDSRFLPDIQIFFVGRTPMFKISHNNCCGLYIHKTWIYACIDITNMNGRTESTSKYRNLILTSLKNCFITLVYLIYQAFFTFQEHGHQAKLSNHSLLLHFYLHQFASHNICQVS